MNDLLSHLDRFEVSDDEFRHFSVLHGRLHTHRVMAWVCVLAKKLNLNNAGRLAFFSARVHDLGRYTDNVEPGHGFEAAEVYLPKYRGLFEEFGLRPEEYEVVSQAVAWHSRRSEPTLHVGDPNVVKLLKDADGLDRVRLGPEEPDPAYFRFLSTPMLVPAALALYELTENSREITLTETVQQAFFLTETAVL